MHLNVNKNIIYVLGVFYLNCSSDSKQSLLTKRDFIVSYHLCFTYLFYSYKWSVCAHWCIPPSPEELGNSHMSPLWGEIYSLPPPGISCLCTQDDNILLHPWLTSSLFLEGFCFADTRKWRMKVWRWTADPEKREEDRSTETGKLSQEKKKNNSSTVLFVREEHYLSWYIWNC